ncbi:phosphate ABC transporter substrate-binding protein [Thermoanaerobacter pentosaceus]|uniref:Phosphate-binding protein n=1 Tax=Thermoanaerobacter pentosaceus TaxID=694059 RepID=A0ABT9M3L1_9THEO|nr:phosphate ABC transporter substrate-binding protein [Thermoanaerobacter pentosaceus]MDP9750717.1 phosphate transport system substrate-binding protein [Thermoanaerobacter pentosaceus]
MLNSRFPKVAIAVLLIASFFTFAACGSKQPQSDDSTTTTDNLSGNITIAGSTALQPLAEQAAKMFMEKYPNVAITVQGGGSGTGLTQVVQGAIDIGNSDISAEEKLDAEAAKSLVDHKVAVVGFAVVVNKDVTVDNLTQQQLVDIFTGKITNWREVGGQDEKITVILRPASSGTRATFKKIVLKGQEEAVGLALTEDSNGAVKRAVADTKGAISYISLAYIDDTVKVLKYNGVEPTAQNIIDGKYPIWSYEHMYTKGEPTGAVKVFLDFMTSDEVQKGPLTKLGFIPVTEMKTK